MKWQCEFCGKEFSTKNKTERHEDRCTKSSSSGFLYFMIPFIIVLIIFGLMYVADNNESQSSTSNIQNVIKDVFKEPISRYDAENIATRYFSPFTDKADFNIMQSYIEGEHWIIQAQLKEKDKWYRSGESEVFLLYLEKYTGRILFIKDRSGGIVSLNT